MQLLRAGRITLHKRERRAMCTGEVEVRRPDSLTRNCRACPCIGDDNVGRRSGGGQTEAAKRHYREGYVSEPQDSGYGNAGVPASVVR